MSGIGAGYRRFEITATNSATTTGRVDMRGRAIGTVENRSGGSVTITYYAAHDTADDPIPLVDAFGSAVEQTVGDDEAAAMPEACAHAAILCPVIDSASAALSFGVKR